MLELTRVYHFSAGHRLENPALSRRGERGALRPVLPAARPQLLPGSHGGAVGPTPPDRHVGGSRPDRRRRALSAVLDHVDHQTLEEVPALAGRRSRLARAWPARSGACWRRRMPAGRAWRVTVVETAKNRFQYEGEAAR